MKKFSQPLAFSSRQGWTIIQVRRIQLKSPNLCITTWSNHIKVRLSWNIQPTIYLILKKWTLEGSTVHKYDAFVICGLTFLRKKIVKIEEFFIYNLSLFLPFLRILARAITIMEAAHYGTFFIQIAMLYV